MNWEHFKAFVWLRWRLLYNQARRAGVFNAVLHMIVAVGRSAHGDPAIHRRLDARALRDSQGRSPCI